MANIAIIFCASLTETAQRGAVFVSAAFALTGAALLVPEKGPRAYLPEPMFSSLLAGSWLEGLTLPSISEFVSDCPGIHAAFHCSLPAVGCMVSNFVATFRSQTQWLIKLCSGKLCRAKTGGHEIAFPSLNLLPISTDLAGSRRWWVDQAYLAVRLPGVASSCSPSQPRSLATSLLLSAR